MGNSALSVSIDLDHEKTGTNVSIVAGSSLCGKITASVTKRIKPSPKLTLYAIGKEKTRIEGGEGSTEACERVFFSAQVVLCHPSEEGVEPGRYIYPFKIDLPSSLPSSIDAQPYHHKDICRIHYKLHVNSHAKRLFTVVSAPLEDEKVEAFIPPASYPLESFGFNKGHLCLGAKVVDTHVGKGLPLEIHLASRNDALVNIERVAIKLIETIRYNTRHHSRDFSRTLTKKRDVHLPGLFRNKLTRSERSNRTLENHFSEIYQDLLSAANKTTLKVPHNVSDSYTGELIQISHHLDIIMSTPFLTTNPSISIPIQIGFPPPCVVQLSVPSVEPTNVPVAQATLVLEQNLVQPPLGAVAAVPVEAMVLGGIASAVDLEDDENQNVNMVHDSHMSSISSPDDVSISGLLEEMTFSINDYDIIRARLHYPAWASLMSCISPEEMGAIVAHVNKDVDQPKVAELLARHMNSGFTCQHCVAASTNSSDWIRTATVQRLVPLCSDILVNHNVIKESLCHWEWIVTEADINNAISRARAINNNPDNRKT